MGSHALPPGEPIPMHYTTPPEPERDWLAEAQRAYVDGNAEQAVYAAREAIARDGRNAAAWITRSLASTALRHFDDAEFEAREATRLGPDIAEGHAALAEILEIKERYGEATREIDQAIRLAPGLLRYRGTKASISLSAGQTLEARRQFEALAAEDPDEEMYRRFLAQALLNEAEEQTTQLPGGRHAITSPQQLAFVRSHMTQALALQFNDSALRDDLRAVQAEAASAERVKWQHSPRVLWYYGTALVAFVIGLPGLSHLESIPFTLLFWAIAAGVIWIYVRRHRKAMWAWNAQAAPEEIRRG